jgi:two-component system, chemotaxis family, protein-glutamate methylesterase/glutaminase
MSEKTKIIIVDDSMIISELLKKVLGSNPMIEVLGTATDGIEGLKLIEKLNPDVVCTDLLMPNMDGLEFTKEIMKRFPRPILVISSAIQDENITNVFKLIEAGAVDVCAKPHNGAKKDYEAVFASLINKIIEMKTLKPSLKPKPIQKGIDSVSKEKAFAPNEVKYLLIGASTGGPVAYQTLLSALAKNFPVPILCVQHIGKGFVSSLVQWLSQTTNRTVKIMEDGEIPKAGITYFPQDNTHMILDKFGKLQFFETTEVIFHKPSVNVLFDSVAKNSTGGTISVLLTGMGDDGAKGLLNLKNKGSFTITESPSSAVIYGMPKVAFEIGASVLQLPLNTIGMKINQLLKL